MGDDKDLVSWLVDRRPLLGGWTALIRATHPARDIYMPDDPKILTKSL